MVSATSSAFCASATFDMASTAAAIITARNLIVRPPSLRCRYVSRSRGREHRTFGHRSFRAAHAATSTSYGANGLVMRFPGAERGKRRLDHSARRSLVAFLSHGEAADNRRRRSARSKLNRGNRPMGTKGVMKFTGLAMLAVWPLVALAQNPVRPTGEFFEANALGVPIDPATRIDPGSMP